ncbi:penicillin acylase family protein [Rhodanobacter glycinis]|uniref:Penicillin acylase family protein n=1 Tax=Rhodanobacter glycinis TaxID=582702 RepID=A0A5B9E409_9GAMM|nr:penicillin acylase family protein [Rhodanobacter glycinis]QEE25330.1 penicillin acylase family protein [Rhodanobacter glycinis]
MTKKSRRFRWLTGLALAVLALLLIAVGTGWWLLAGSRAQLDGSRHLAELAHPVSITRDALGTATFTGQSRDDIDVALGYVHAQERFFEMDLMRRMAAGELSALVGPAALKLDLNHRRHRLRAVAEAAYARLSPASRHTLELYSEGVNAGLAAMRERPWEYLLLRTRPQPWKPEDCLLVIAAMYLDLNSDGRNQRELRLAQMRAVLPASLTDFLLSPAPVWEAPLQGGLSRSPVVPGANVFDLRQSGSPAGTAKLAATLAATLEAKRPGSNNFAVGGQLTQSGAAALANDMHLGLRVPDIWFRTRLRYPDASAPNGQRDVVGVSLPGTPAMVVGSNGQIAWGFTNSYGDWLDWVRVQRDPKDPSRYKVPGGWASIQTHDETIQVKGAPSHVLKVEDTRWGPIMGKAPDGTPLALDWIAQHPRAYNLDLMQLEHAGDVKAALDLAPGFGIPPQNLLVADSAGHIGWTIAGNAIPLRHGFDPQLPADWSQAGSGWIGWAAPAQYPRIEDPADHRLWTANNRTVGGSALALLGNGGHDIGARAQQIRNDLHARAGFSPGNLLDIQLDDRAVFLTRWQRLLQQTLAHTDDPALLKLKKLTAIWRERAAPNSVDYRLVRAFRNQVKAEVMAPFVAHVKQHYPDFSWPRLDNPEAAVWALVHQQPANLLDPRFKDWHALLIAAAKHVTDTLGSEPGGLAARTWGEVNHADIDHPLARALPGFLAHYLDMPDDELPGDHDMPRVAAPGFGASERLDVEPGHEAHGILEMPGGQSDNPLSPYYGAGHEDWVHGRPTPLLPGPAQHTLTLEPAA